MHKDNRCVYMAPVCCVAGDGKDSVFSLEVLKLFGESIRNIFGCGCYFVVECYRSLECGWRCSVG